ncbi:aldo/keto reductase [Flagellimonas sp. HMM57]|uniref:aldo/keto reductase n=1 Tax=unclassified Flagellimonas TaxID=2644544 RepID=UPI001F0AB803|nr:MULTISPECIES: aldo/keto reductase [unclassified Flagellimonas]UII76700.1 aldo/keto reductase [Flagellimonas sp. HMM57]
MENTFKFELNNKIMMPQMGLGVLFAKNDEEVENAVISALHTGYRKIDTASAYQNEEGVGKAIKKSTISRADVFITTKVWNSEQGYDKTLYAFDESLIKLDTDYVDMYLIHWPVKFKYRETYRAMEEIYKSGRAKAIGVCNFSIDQLKNLMGDAEVVPALNQVEMHPYCSQNDMMDFAGLHNIQLEAWRPIMMGEVLNIPELREIGKIHQKSAVQVTLRWLIQRGVAVIPKSITPKRIRENFEIFDFELSEREMTVIEGLNKNRRLGEDLSHVV